MQGDQKRLKFGIMCPGTGFPAWQASCIRQLIKDANAQLALIILDDRPSGGTPLLKRVGLNRLLGLAHRRLFAVPGSMRIEDLSGDLAGVPTLRCTVKQVGKFTEVFSEDDVRQIEAHELDFILRFGFNIIRGAILDAARYGVWSFHHGDEQKFRGAPPGFWEIYTGDPVTGSILQRLTDTLDGGIVLKKGFFPTVDYSYKANLDRILTDSAVWPTQVCLDIQHGNDEYLCEKPARVDAPIFRNPTNLQVMFFFLICLRNLLLKVWQTFFRHELWNVAIVDVPIERFVDAQDFRSVRWIRPDVDNSFIADPFGFTRDGKFEVLCEEFDYGTYRGRITALSEKSSGAALDEHAVFDTSVHYSYPYIFSHDGDLYCVPETSEAREAKLYRRNSESGGWEAEATLISDFAAVDSTVIRHNGRWWLFCTNAEDGRYDKLHIWHAESLTGAWRPHHGNPVKIDIRSARPAGTPFVHKGSLYRPSQDCSQTYGGQISLNRVIELSETSFTEELCRSITPDADGPYPDGLHTLSRLDESRSLIDAKRYRFYFGGFIHAAKFLGRSLISRKGG